MNKRWFKLSVLLVVFAMLLTACAAGATEEPTALPTEAEGLPETGQETVQATEEATPTEAVTEEATEEATPTGEAEMTEEPAGETGAAFEAGENDWPLANKDYENTRAALNAQIDSENVDQLGVAWAFDIPGIGAYGAAASAPLIIGDTVYFQDLASNLFAFDRESGEVLWEQIYDMAVVGPNGPAYGYGKIFAHVGSNSVRALDAETGEELWNAELEHPTGAHQPYVYNGMVYTGTLAGLLDPSGEGDIALRGYAGGASGHVFALDQETGEVVWQFQTVEEGFWGNEEVNSGGGIWYPPAIDTESGVTYWGTGNPAPFPGTAEFPNGSSRPGENLYTSSVLALDGETGELIWYNQLKPHDLFDHDAQISPILAMAEVDGEQRQVVIGSGKLGVVVAMDAETGDELWSMEVGEHENDDLQELEEGETVTVLPGTYGGVETPMAFADGVLYVPVLNLPTPFNSTGFDAADGTEAVQAAEARTDLSEGSGVMVAIDVASGEILWEHPFEENLFGGATVVNDLVFTSTFDGTVHALSREDGSEVWTWQAPTGINAWLSVSDDMLIIPAGVGERPMLIALQLGAEGEIPVTGEEGEATPTGDETPTEGAPGATETPGGADMTPTASAGGGGGDDQLIAMGEEVYLDNCSRCHGPNGQGSGGFPALAGNALVTGEADPVILQVLHGGGAMPPFEDVLDNEQIAAVVSYIRNTWGNQASTVSADQVEQARSQ